MYSPFFVLLTRRFISLFICLPICVSIQLNAQQHAINRNSRDQGITLYKENDYQNAVRILRAAVEEDAQDAEAWHYFGLALVNTGDLAQARYALERAVEIGAPSASKRAKLAYIFFGLGRLNEAVNQVRQAQAEAALVGSSDADADAILGTAYVKRQRQDAAAGLKNAEAALQLNPQSASAYLQKALALIALTTPEGEIKPQLSRTKTAPPDEKAAEVRRSSMRNQLQEAAMNVEKYLSLSSKNADSNYMRQQLEALRIYTKNINNPAADQPIYNTSQVTTKARVISKPEPGYTVRARKNDISGVISVRAVLAADGTVKYPLILLSLPHGLTEKALNAVSKIKFEPATKDGRPASQQVVINYAFSIY